MFKCPLAELQGVQPLHDGFYLRSGGAGKLVKHMSLAPNHREKEYNSVIWPSTLLIISSSSKHWKYLGLCLKSNILARPTPQKQLIPHTQNFLDLFGLQLRLACSNMCCLGRTGYKSLLWRRDHTAKPQDTNITFVSGFLMLEKTV